MEKDDALLLCLGFSHGSLGTCQSTGCGFETRQSAYRKFVSCGMITRRFTGNLMRLIKNDKKSKLTQYSRKLTNHCISWLSSVHTIGNIDLSRISSKQLDYNLKWDSVISFHLCNLSKNLLLGKFTLHTSTLPKLQFTFFSFLCLLLHFVTPSIAP